MRKKIYSRQEMADTRMVMIRNSVISLAALTAFSGCQKQNEEQDHQKPNVIFVITDDQHRSEFNFLPSGQDENGNGVNLTPNIDQLVGEGVHFSNMYCTSPVSTPSRYSCLTGQYPSRSLTPEERDDNQTAVHWNTKVTASTPTFPKVLRKKGYYTGAVGKIHGIDLGKRESVPLDADPRDPEVIKTLKQNQQNLVEQVKNAGFHYAKNLYHGNPYGEQAPDELRVHNLDWIFKGAVDFINKAKEKEKPFFLWVATTVSHSPYQPERAYDANPLATPAGYLDDTIRIMPPRHTIPERIKNADIPQEHFNRKCNLLWLDDGIGALREKLEELGVDDNTVIIYFNDHGTEAGGKGSLYQKGVKSVGFAWSKDIFSGGKNFEPKIQNIDFAPTILDLGGISPGKHEFIDGESILPALQGKSARVHESLYFELGNARAIVMDSLKYYAVRHPSRIKNMSYEDRKKLLDRRARRAQRRGFDEWPVKDPSTPFGHIGMFPGGFSFTWKAMDKHPHYFDEDQLYNLNRDPEETVNLAEKPGYQEELEKMKAELNRYVKNLPGDFGEFGDTTFVN
jgi:arylsulfatase A-like enzyme